MSWPTPNSTFTEQISAQRVLAKDFSAFLGAIWTEGLVARRTLEMCRLRIVAIHDCDPAMQENALAGAKEAGFSGTELTNIIRGDVGSFSEGDCAVLAIAEKIPHQAHAVTDDEVAALKNSIGEPAGVSLLTALAMFDAECRLANIFESHRN